ncbi:MAG: membrane protein insertion efficiency factor YidD [Clostridia bacterium]
MLIYPIRLYQKYISKLLGSNCRFTPSCSEYAAQAIDKYGIIIGSFKAIRRILRCHPFNEGGYDPLK